MATIAPPPNLTRALSEPLRGAPLITAGLIVWLAGAAYCHGYERLLSGASEWPGSLSWSAIAVMPWFALFEWSKQPRGAEVTRRPRTLIGLVLGVAAASVIVEYLVNWCLDDVTDHLSLLVLRRLPAIGATLLLIALARKSASSRPYAETADLRSLAHLIDYVAAADNYVEIHLNGRIILRRMTLTDAAQTLERRGFIRVHRRFLVNRAQISEVHQNGKARVRLKSGAELPVGRAYAPNVRLDA